MQHDMTAICAADVTLAQAQHRLAESDQWLPMDGDPDRPLGSLLEENSTGPLRLGYGAWRDLLLGTQFRNGQDELISAGGITMKNVAGYDLTKFSVGQHGVFARIVTLATRTYRRPAMVLHATFPPELPIVQRLLPTSLRPRWTLLTPDSLLAGYYGDEAAIDFFGGDLATACPVSVERTTLDADIALRSRLWARPSSGIRTATLTRISLPPARVTEFVSAAGLQQFIADPVFGVIRLFDTSPDTFAPLMPRFSARMIHFDGKRLLNFNVTPEEQQILRRLKSAFDPGSRLTSLEFAS